MEELNALPTNLPVPEDDGACQHLEGMPLPDIRLRTHQGQLLNLSLLCGRTVVFIYPMTGRPDKPLPAGWNSLPGARGCTTEACGFRDNIEQFSRLGLRVFGLSTQSDTEQQEAAARLQLPYTLLSDEKLLFAKSLNLPLFECEGVQRIKRLTLICRTGFIERCVYPVFPPDSHADDLLAILSSSPSLTG